MTTTVTKSIGSAGGRDYATPADFFAAVPADLVAADQAWVGECYNDSLFTTTWTTGSHTTDVTRNITLKCASGQSFDDNAGRRTNALRYNQSNGVACDTTNVGAANFTVACNNVTLDGLQLRDTGGGAFTGQVLLISGTNCTVQNCIIMRNEIAGQCIYSTQTDASLLNSLVYFDSSSDAGSTICIYFPNGGGFMYQVTVANLGSNGKGASNFGSAGSLYDTIIAGFSTAADWTSGDYNLTDLSSGVPGAHSVFNASASSQFTDVTVGAPDFRIKAGSTAINAGEFLFFAPLDIVLTTRSLTTTTIGAWEVVSASTLLKDNGVTVANISKLDSIAYASVKAANGLTTGN